MASFPEKLALAVVMAVVIGVTSAVSLLRLADPNQCEQTVAVVPEKVAQSERTVLGSEDPITSGDIAPEEVPFVLELKPGERKTSVRTSYDTPAGSNDIGFSVVVDEDDIIRDASVEVLATHEISRMRQQSFAKELPEILKGKKLHELQALDLVGESSLTTKAFNESLDALRSK